MKKLSIKIQVLLLSALSLTLLAVIAAAAEHLNSMTDELHAKLETFRT